MSAATENNRYLSLEKMPEILTAQDISEYLNICYNKALDIIKYGGMKHIKIGTSYRVPKNRFVEWINDETGK